MAQRRLTRAELAARTGLSKPTVSDSVRRLCEAGLLADTGERTTGRGRVGSYYALAEDVGCALVVSVAPGGDRRRAARRPRRRDVDGDRRGRAPGTAGAGRRGTDGGGPAGAEGCLTTPRLAVVSAADPVDRATGRLVHLPDSPFLLGELSPADVLAGLVDGPVMVDNDVNWAARAERDAGGPQLDDFVYLHLGEGLGCAVVNDGEVRRGHAGLVGEIAHVLTTGPDGRAVPLIDVFGALGLRHPASTAIDVHALLAAVERDDARARDLLATLARAICGVLAAVVAFSDPATRRHRRDVGHRARRPRRHRRGVRATPPPRPDPGRATHRRTLPRRRQEPRTPRASSGHRHLHPIALSRYEAYWTTGRPRRSPRTPPGHRSGHNTHETAPGMISGGPFRLVAGVGFEPTTSGL